MIYFHSELVAQAKKMIAEAETHDLIDIANDFRRINSAIATINFPNGLWTAHQLDAEMHQKYPMIDTMLCMANNMRRIPSVNASSVPYTSAISDAINRLQQDMYGILCDALMKKGCIHSAEQFIERVGE